MMKLLILAVVIYFVFSLAACGLKAAMPEPGFFAPFFAAATGPMPTSGEVVDAKFTHLSEDAEPTVLLMMVDGQLYWCNGRENDIDGRCGMMDGCLSSSVERNKIPSRDGQSNFGAPYAYQYGENGEIEVNIDQHWMVFEPVQSPSVQ